MRENIIVEKINSLDDFYGVVSVKSENKILFEEAFGYADMVNKRKNNLNTRFGIASGAKLFTAISICKLVQEGKLSFETKLKEYVNIDNYDENITVEQLLTHTSGIPDYFDEDVMSDFSDLWIENPMYLLRTPSDFKNLLSEGIMKSKPGEEFSYNNSAFIVLSLVVEKVSSKPFVEFVKENIFDVLDMKFSGHFAMDMMPENCANGYIENKNGTFKSNIYSIPVVGGGDGGVFINAHDMTKLWNGLFDYKLLDKEMTEKLLTAHVHVNDNVYYGYGIWILKRNDEIFKYYITGSDPGIDFISSIYPRNKLEVTVLSNKEFGAYDITKCIEDNM